MSKKRYKVLLVEDNPLTQKVTQLVLEGLNCDVDVATSGEAALNLFNKDYQLILMDLILQELDGIETTRQIRAKENGKTVPIVAMTAHALDSDQEQCYNAGMNDIIVKPISLDSIQVILSKYFEEETVES